MKKTAVILLMILGTTFSVRVSAQTASFTRQTIDPSNSGDGKAVADIDMDGKADGIIGGSSLVWYSGGENFAKYTIRGSVVFTEFTTNIAAGDIDGDGDADIVAPDGAGAGNVLWFENPKLQTPAGKVADPKNGANWVMHTVGSHGNNAHTVEVGDMNADGKTDIITSGNGHGHVWLFQGKDSFQDVNIGVANGSTGGAQSHDINKDGKLDIVYSGGWLQNNGNGTSYTTRAVSGFFGEEVGAGDLNGDARPDLIGSVNAHERGVVNIFFFPADPTSSSWTSKVLDNNMCSHRPLVVDFNSDGKNDVLLGCELAETSVYMGTGGGNFQKTQLDTASGHNAAVGDLNGDGKIDIFSSDWIGHPPVKVYINTMSGGSVPSPTLPPGGTVTWNKWKYINVDATRMGTQFLWGLGMGDIDGDGDGDIAAGSYYYLNPGGTMEGTWNRKSGLGDAQHILSLDNDQYMDVIDLGGGPKWLEWDPSSSQLVQRAQAAGPGGEQGVTSADVIAGGAEEVVYSAAVGPDDSNKSAYMLSFGTNSMSANKIAEGLTHEGVALADFDGDGKLDLAAGDGTNVLWFKNNGTSSRWMRNVIGQITHGSGNGGWTDKVSAADIDRDGRADIIVSEETFGPQADTYWYRNPGGGATGAWQRKTIATQDTTNSMSVADMDRDGDIDVITGEHRGDKELVIYENINNGASWTRRVVDSGKESHGGAKVFDLDNDGDLDIVSIAYDAPADLHVWRNDNTLSGGGTSCPASKPRGDANCDGKVTLTDFETWRREYKGTVQTKTADFDSSGQVTLADYQKWRATFLSGT